MLLRTSLLILFIRILKADSQYSCTDNSYVTERNNIQINVKCYNSTCKWITTDNIGETEIIDPKSLTLQEIIDYCGSYSLYKCVDDSTDKSLVPTDLIWRDDCSSCPMCPCDTSSDDETFYLTQQPTVLQKNCYEFTCENDAIANTDVWRLSNSYNASGPKTLEVFDCPPLKCTKDDGQTANLDETWWDNTECTKFCVCVLDGTEAKIKCETGYDKIIDVDSTVRDEFFGKCGNNVAHCMEDATRLENSGSGECSDCPTCTCGMYNSTSEDYYQAVSYYSTERFGYADYSSQSKSCYKCNCNNDQMDCELVENTYNHEEYDIQCPSEFECYQGNQFGSLNLESCNSNTKYCANVLYETSEETFFSNVTTWGCNDGGMSCRLYGDAGSCTYTENTGEFHSINCSSFESTTKTVTITDYVSCTDEKSNNVMFDKTKCTKNEVVTQGISKYYNCLNQDISAYLTAEIFCSDYDDEMFIENFTNDDACNYISVINLMYVCLCSAFDSMWENLDTEQKEAFADYLKKVKVEHEYLSEWAEFFDCDLDFTCHLTSDSQFVNVTVVEFELSMPWANEKYDDETIIEHLISKVTFLSEESITITSASVEDGVYTASVKVSFSSKTLADMFSSNLEDGSIYCFGDSESDCGSVDAESISISTETIDESKSESDDSKSNAASPALFMLGGVLLLAQFISY